MAQANSGTWSRIARAPGDITLAALLAAGAVTERARAPRRAWLAAVPIVFVNFVAFRAQLRFWQDQLDRGDALLVSAALESVAIYLAWQAHRALVRNDSALRLRLAAYGWAAGMGVLNYSHYCRPGWRPTAAAVVFGLMSAVSPWLWSIHSRRESRDDLKARGLIEDHGVRLGFARWFWYPLRSALVQRLAAWAGENRPAEAIALHAARRAARKQEKAPAGNRASVTAPAGASPVTRTPPSARPRREPRRAATAQREAREPGPGLAAASPQDEAKREARRENGRRGAAIRWGKQPAAVLAGQGASRNGSSHDGA